MREIKFRAWDVLRKRMVIEGLAMNYENSGDENPFDNAYDEQERQIEDFFFMQFTGLKDKNGKEIYEGDIVEYLSRVKYVNYHSNDKATETGLIVWKNNSFKIDMFGFIYEDERFYNINQNNLKVIGNIYENKELLK